MQVFSNFDIQGFHQLYCNTIQQNMMVAVSRTRRIVIVYSTWIISPNERLGVCRMGSRVGELPACRVSCCTGEAKTNGRARSTSWQSLNKYRSKVNLANPKDSASSEVIRLPTKRSLSGRKSNRRRLLQPRVLPPQRNWWRPASQKTRR